jgi:predicted GNAT family acetyltransferase
MRDPCTAHVLDNPVYASLSSPRHAHLARRRGRVLRYLDDVAPFMGLPADPTERDWADAAHVLGSGTAAYVHDSDSIPSAWTVADRFDLVQMTASGTEHSASDTRVVRLEAPDVPDMLDLTRRTAPGPFLPRTIELGTYLGIRHDGVLAAMAGERMRSPGWVEISAVCTAPEQRGKGLGSLLVRAVAAHITARGDRAFLHVAASNTAAVRLYNTLGFTVRRELHLAVLRPPGSAV